ncbi:MULTISPECIES: hypothetical protein [Bacillus cereus group]|uniref:hypothetical protein n=1 Tax=Bacillus cereus group TaxID=86661 RepID=UPI00094242B3|nr:MULTISPECIES: hypothetical protein [Bacillus cereus group]PEB05726.1 hypothetical protein COM56_17410 [Bacillus cereus]MCZ7522344.1 hypothetical protein [Bacillus pacificus]MDA1575429.1 hypothetical protein [Bacillus cereus group sp. TH242-3LC]MED1583770.1 hypothetical protein [Bacillus pacificus]RRB05266.1 hypothetical protein EH195_07720 [Bacillus pacificus]
MNEVVEFFRNYGPIIMFIIGITGLGTSLFYFLKNRKRKRLEYVILNKTPLFNQLHSKMKIYFNNQEIKEGACLSILTIENIGNEPIREDEFEKSKPLKINFIRGDGAQAKIFDVEIYKSNPLEFDVEFEYTELEGTLAIKPILFNPKDYITLKLISTEFEKINISGRIIGGSIVNDQKRKKRKDLLRVGVSLAFAFGGFISSIFKVEAYMIGSIITMIVFIGFLNVNELMQKKKEQKENHVS